MITTLRCLRHPARRGTIAATCLAALLALTALTPAAQAQTGALDTSALPRPTAQKTLVAIPQTTIILSAESVPNAAKAAITLLEAQGWQRFENPFGMAVPPANTESHLLKKGGQAMTLFVQMAAAHNNATAIQYTPLPLERDLPFPAQARGFRFSPDRLHLDAQVAQSPEALLGAYRPALVAMGWTLHSASDGSAPMTVATGEGLQHAFFTHPSHGALHVNAQKKPEGFTLLTVRSIPAALLPGAKKPEQPKPAEPVAAAPNPHAAAHAEMGKAMDSMAQDMMKQALQPTTTTRNPALDDALAKAMQLRNPALPPKP